MRFSKSFSISLTCAAIVLAQGCQSTSKTTTETTAAKTPLDQLKAGNDRFTSGTSIHPSIDAESIRVSGTYGQKPFASVLSCSDSRVPVELVFDRGVGEIFVVRVAGNIVSTHETGSLEFAFAVLNSPLLVVMGHTECGAVKSAAAGVQATPSINALLAEIRPSVDKVKHEHPNASKEEIDTLATRENVLESVRTLYRLSPLIREKVASGQLQIAAAMIDVTTGKVEWLPNTPMP